MARNASASGPHPNTKNRIENPNPVALSQRIRSMEDFAAAAARQESLIHPTLDCGGSVVG
jgi:hypothetical protein